MPEGPEIALNAVFLQKRLPGYSIFNLKYDSNSKQVKNLKSLCLPILIKGVTVKGKKLVFILDNDTYLVFSLGMSGHFSWTERNHTRIRFDLQSNDQKQSLYFDDVRKFGFVEVFHSAKTLLEKLDKIGLDFLTGNISYEYWLSTSKKFAKKQVCQFLLNQDYVSGIGNIYRAEICYIARINPTRTVGSLSEKELINLYNSSYKIIKNAFNSGASKGYRNPDGKSGEYKCLVYMQKKDAFGNTVISQKCKDRRTIHWVPDVQK